MTGSRSDKRVSAETSINSGFKIAGIPSLGGPPERISEKSTEWIEKSVFGHSRSHRDGSAMAVAAVPAITNENSVAIVSEVLICSPLAKNRIIRLKIHLPNHPLTRCAPAR